MSSSRNALTLAFVFAALALAGCNKSEDSAPSGETSQAGPGGIPLPPYVEREKAPEGNRLAGGRDPKAIYEHACGYCHLPGGMGSNLLTKQRVAMGEPPENGVLTNRTDLTPDYVTAVVRNGKAAMPPQTRVDITDAELNEVAQWLSKSK
ncbi:MAG: c-type cytochrome [Sphingomonadaceae bacterium]